MYIKQDDEVDKLNFFPEIDLIFGVTSIIVVANLGSDPNADLPSVKLGSQIHIQKPFKINCISFLQTLDPMKFGDKLSLSQHSRSYLSKLEWYHRG